MKVKIESLEGIAAELPRSRTAEKGGEEKNYSRMDTAEKTSGKAKGRPIDNFTKRTGFREYCANMGGLFSRLLQRTA